MSQVPKAVQRKTTVLPGSKPASIVGWLITNVDGRLYSYKRRNPPCRVKHLKDTKSKPRSIKLSTVGGCSFDQRQNILLKCLPTEDKTLSIWLESTIHLEVINFELKDGEMREVRFENEMFSTMVIEKESLYPPKKELIPRIDFKSYGFVTPKRQAVGEKHMPRCAITLYNDGVHLYTKSEQGFHFLRFSVHRRESWLGLMPGGSFSEPMVVLKTFGHTISGSVIVMIRELNNNWSVTFAIHPNQTVSVDDLHSHVGVIDHK